MIDNFRHKGLREKLTAEIKSKGISDERILNAINKIPRHFFMDSSFVNFAYRDQAFPIGANQTISQPFTVAFQTQLLEVEKNDKILEVGTGSGYQSAVLLELGAKIYTIERQRELFLKSQTLLKSLKYNPHFFFGDGFAGLPAYAPFNKIIITAGATEIPKKLLEQLTIGGRMVIPFGDSEKQQMYLIQRISETEYKRSKHGGDFAFVPMLKGTEK